MYRKQFTLFILVSFIVVFLSAALDLSNSTVVSYFSQNDTLTNPPKEETTYLYLKDYKRHYPIDIKIIYDEKKKKDALINLEKELDVFLEKIFL